MAAKKTAKMARRQQAEWDDRAGPSGIVLPGGRQQAAHMDGDSGGDGDVSVAADTNAGGLSYRFAGFERHGTGKSSVAVMVGMAHLDMWVTKTVMHAYVCNVVRAGIGSRLMRSMGWQEGQGLGRARQGRAEPLAAVQRPKNLGLGAE